MREGKVTLPLIYALRTTNDAKMQSLINQDILNEEDIATLIDFAKRNGGIEYAYRTMQRMRDDACKIIAPYPDSEAKQAFLSLFDFIIKRHN